MNYTFYVSVVAGLRVDTSVHFQQ